MTGMPDIFAYQSFGGYLGDYLRAKKVQDPNFSLRRLSRAVKFRSPSLISMIANGHRVPRPDLVFALAREIGLDEKATAYAETLANLERARTASAKVKLEQRLRELAPIGGVADVDLDVFKLISQWHNIAILEFTESRYFQEDPEWLAARLGPTVTAGMARDALELLVRVKLLARGKDGRLVRTANQFKAAHGIPSAAVRAFHKQMLLKAHQAIDKQKVREKSFIGTTLAVPTTKVALAESLLAGYMEDFRRRMTEGEADGQPEELYHVAVQFFRLTTATLGS